MPLLGPARVQSWGHARCTLVEWDPKTSRAPCNCTSNWHAHNLWKAFFFAKEKQRVNSVFDHEYHDGDVGQVWGLQLLKSRSRMRKCGPKRPLKTTSNNQLRAARFSFKYNVTKRPELIYWSHFVAGNVVSFTLSCHNHATSAVKLQCH